MYGTPASLMRSSMYTAIAVSMALSLPRPAIAQSLLEPDATLGPDESSQVVPNGTARDDIEGGAVRGNNLFHSFTDFNVGENRAVYFISPNDSIQNIVTRVTGNNPSNILGTLGTQGGANPDLFLLNPNGIMFGPDAKLDVQGSFFATTGSGLRFGSQGDFDANSPEPPGVLTVNPSALLFNQIAAQGITSEAQGASAIDPGRSNSIGDPVGLEVPDGRTLALVGGNVNISSGSVTALGGRIEVGSVLGPGVVRLESAETNWVLGYEAIAEFGSIRITDQSVLDASGNRPGTLVLRGNDINIARGGTALANTLAAEGGGTIQFQAENSIQLEDKVLVTATTLGTGQAGDIVLNSPNVKTDNEVLIWATTQGKGDGGMIDINANDITLTNQSVFSTQAEIGSEGRGGNIQINGDHLKISDESRISSASLGTENAGSLNIIATESISVDLVSKISAGARLDDSNARGGNIVIATENLNLSGASEIETSTFSRGNSGALELDIEQAVISGEGTLVTSQTESIGQSGNIRISGKTLELSDSAAISTATFEAGDGGDLKIDMNDEVNLNNGVLSILTRGEGNAGLLEIKTPTLILSERARVLAETRGSGNAGNLSILANDVVIASQSEVSSTTNDSGNAGNIDIRGKNILIKDLNTSIFAQPLRDATGNGGEISISGDSLAIEDGAFVSISTLGDGNAGRIIIDVSNVELSGLGSGLFARVSEPDATGQGGNIKVLASSVDVSNEAAINVGTEGAGQGGRIDIQSNNLNVDRAGFISSVSSGAGNAGDIEIDVGEIFRIADGGLILAFVDGDGNGGILSIDARELAVTNNSVITTATLGAGNASAANIRADEVRLEDNGRIATSVVSGSSGNGGNLKITGNRLLILSGSDINASTTGSGSGGSLSLEMAELVRVNGTDTIISADVREGATGQSGSLEIISGDRVLIDDGGQISTATLGSGRGGNLNIIGRSVSLVDGGVIAASTFADGNSGSLSIHSTELTEIDGIQTGVLADSRANASGNSGRISIRSDDRITIANGGAVSASTQGSGRGGLIELEGQQIDVGNSAVVTSSTTGEGDAGAIAFKADAIEVFSQGRVDGITARDATGRGGEIAFEGDRLYVFDAGLIATSTFGRGNAGNLNVNVSEIAIEGNSFLGAQVAGRASSSGQDDGFAEGSGGELFIVGDTLEMRDGGQISASTLGFGDAGNLTIAGFTKVSIDGSASSIVAETRKSFGAGGSAGNLSIESDAIALTNGADISTSTFGSGDGGTLNIVSKDLLLSVAERSADDEGSFIAVQSQSSGNGGSLTISSDRISILDLQPDDAFEAAIVADALGSGKGGSLTIRTNELTMSDGGISTVTNGSADGGTISIVPIESSSSASITLSDRALVSANAQQNASATARGGNINIETTNLSVNSGAQVSTATRGSGSAGRLDIQADRISLRDPGSGFLASVSGANSAGDGGVLNIRADVLEIADGARISSSSEGLGEAGNIQLSLGDSLDVTDASITTESRQSGGGNIDIEVANDGNATGDIALFQGSRLTANVFGGTGGGGDISTTSLTFVALDDSDILAFADEGDGGNITIQAPVFLADIFGGDGSSEDADLSDFSRFFGNNRVDINASSRFGLDGAIEISDAGFLESTLAPLASDFSRSDLVVAGSCLARQNADRGSFVVTGTGGLPRSPYENSSSPYEAIAVRPLADDASEAVVPQIEPNASVAEVWKPGDPVREAATLVATADGRVLLSSAAGDRSSVATAGELVCQ